MNRLPLSCPAPGRNLPLICCGRRRYAQQLLSNTPLRTLAPRQLQTFTRSVLEPPPNVFTPTAKATASRTIAAPRALFNSLIPSCKTRHCQRRWTPFSANFMPVEPLHNTVSGSPVILEGDFRLGKEAYLTFPPKVNDSITRETIERFSVNIENPVKHIDHVYCCFSWFVDPLQLKRIFDNNLVLMAVFETNILHCCEFHVCSCCSRSFNFCHDC